MATSAAAAAVARARRQLQHEFFQADAVRPDRAIAFTPEQLVERRIFERWQRAGVIRENGPGRYWLDVVAYDVEVTGRFKRQRAILLMLVVVLAAIAVGLVGFGPR